MNSSRPSAPNSACATSDPAAARVASSRIQALTHSGRFHIGCPVWAHPGWIGTLVPAGTKSRDMLAAYARHFTAVEGNTTFYAVPPPATVARWAAALPERFLLCPKMHRDVTHAGPLAPRLPDALAFLEALSPLGAHLGPVFIQMPGTYAPTSHDDLATFLAGWPKAGPPVHVEVRHPDWFAPAPSRRLAALLAGHDAGRVLLDARPVHDGPGAPNAGAAHPKPRLPVPWRTTCRHLLARFIGHPDVPLNRPWLRPWADAVTAWLREGRDVVFFAHCPDQDHSPAIARLFQSMLEERGAPVPPLPRDERDEPPRQTTLF